MSAHGLIDTGALLAILDRDDPWHEPCVEAIRRLRLPLLTSSAVLTVLFHLLDEGRQEMETAWAFLRSGALVVGSIDHSELPELNTLMSRYWDCRMGFADSTLVCLARREPLTTILTVDRADFETYRIEGKRKFRVVPGGRL
jgi:predicted nucleic acid-binding protein